jgi:hypothetical protein
MVKSILFFITHSTLNLDHAKMCLYHLSLSNINTIVFDEMYIYNTHSDELSNESILELIREYNISKLCGEIKIFEYDTNTQKKLSYDIYSISLFCQKNYNKNDRILLLKSDIMISVNLLSDLCNVESDSFIFTPPFVTAKSRVTNKEIIDYTRRTKFVKSDNITFYNESNVEDINLTDHITKRTPNDNDVFFISCECKINFSCHYLTCDIFKDIEFHDKDCGNVCFEESRNRWISSNNSFTVHKYHSIVSKNRGEEREISLHTYLNQKTMSDILIKKKKILLCVTGHIRTFDNTIDSLTTLIDELIKRGYSIDICFSTYNEKYGYHPYIQSTLNFYKDTKLTDDYFNYIYYKFGMGVNIIINDNEKETLLAKNTLPLETRDIYHGFLTNRRLIDCMNYADVCEEKYSHVIKTRFDCEYNISNFISIFENEMDDDVIYLDENNVYPNDWILISSFNNIKKLSTTVNSEYINPTSEMSITNPPHGFLQYFIYKEKLKVKTKHLSNIIRYSISNQKKYGHIICHRGNINGPSVNENSIDQINMAIELGFDVEIDVRIVERDERLRDEKNSYLNHNQYNLYLGHDKPDYKVELDFILQNSDRLWIHCKDYKSLEFFNTMGDTRLNYFYHTDEDYILTSKSYIWCFPGKELLRNSICVMPELDKNNNGNVEINKNIKGICTDYPFKYLMYNTK